MKEVKKESHLVYKGKIIEVFKDLVFVDGKTFQRDVVRKQKAVASLIFNEDKTKVLLVSQYRYPIDKETKELPAGKVEQEETLAEAMIRETEEETGLVPTKYEELGTFYTSLGFCDEEITLFVVWEYEESEQRLEDDEKITLMWESVHEIMKETKYFDPKAMLALSMYWSKYGKN